MKEEFTVKVSSPGEFIITFTKSCIEYIGSGNIYCDRNGGYLTIKFYSSFHEEILAKQKWALKDHKHKSFLFQKYNLVRRLSQMP